MTDQPSEGTGRDAGCDAERHCAGEVGERERWRSAGGQDRRGAVDRDECEVAGCGADQRREQHPASEVVLVRNLECEDGAGRGRLEDRGDSGGGAGNEQEPAVRVGHEAGEASLEERPDGRAEIERGPFEAHRAAEAEGRDRGEHPPGELSDPQWTVSVVERSKVGVGGCRIVAPRDIAQAERREHQTDARDEREQPRRQLADVVKEHVDDDAFEQRHA